MALQELDLHIEYHPRRVNAHADALSRYPVSLLQNDVTRTRAQPLVAAVMDEPPAVAEDGEKSSSEQEDTLSQRQC